ncbi:cobalt-precorrin-5B (C(1))-methyltransferase CbiD [Aphanothece sacrum]|uniref:Cobalt-precorrin-5B C(1)-methyltransferase n=1 Tax=Aphanothece sacrum FPU1 TaxID=1920663 RepID=A0A401ILC2_APHSA|nr:cobalt-precorrin-5B (C(1))-methyltransferase CbiD [Aphanothece sacrum]GBF82053.1 cobalt-precorrin-6A synthase [Aphanothece sacrum FPU1]GBF85866.1 cobalt-precorrin-6A synthase [Aphanothece sacrum FPU3]
MNNNLARSGYTLPVFACASAIAALHHLQNKLINDTVSLDLIDPNKTVNIPIQQVAKLQENTALAITISDPGDNLDLTRNTPIWAIVELSKNNQSDEQIIIKGGEGIGKQINNEQKDAIYNYAKKLLNHNLKQHLSTTESIIVTIILPEGRKLAKRTSNEAFGVVEGLSLLGTTGISQPLSAPGQLDIYQQQLKEKAQQFDTFVFCIGENGLDLAQKIGINSQQLIKTANWLGPLLVTAGLEKVQSILLFGYHGKLIKLAGGIFHTHHHLADGRREILVAHGAKIGLSTTILQQLFTCETTEDGLQLLRTLDQDTGSHWTQQIYQSIADTIDQRTQAYISKYVETDIKIGSVLFGRDRSIIITSKTGKVLLDKLD